MDCCQIFKLVHVVSSVTGVIAITQQQRSSTVKSNVHFDKIPLFAFAAIMLRGLASQASASVSLALCIS
jgi:hypothetical protein